MLADASITLRNRSSAFGLPLDAMRPMSQIAVRCASRLVVTMKSLRPARYSRATASSVPASTYFAISVAQRPRLEEAGPDEPAHALELEEILHLAAREHGPQHLVVAGAEIGKGRDQGAGAGAGDDGELRTVAARAPAVQKARAERAVGAAARQGENGRLLRYAGGGCDAFLSHRRIVRPYPGVRKARDDRQCLFLLGIGDTVDRRATGGQHDAKRGHGKAAHGMCD